MALVTVLLATALLELLPEAVAHGEGAAGGGRLAAAAAMRVAAGVVLAPLGRLASIDDVGAVAAMLATRTGAMLTGQTIYVDGGYQILG